MWRRWGEAHFVFHPASGQTHFLNEIAAAILHALELGPVTAADLQSLVTTRFEIQIEDFATLQESIAETLGSLDRLGLVSQTP